MPYISSANPTQKEYIQRAEHHQRQASKHRGSTSRNQRSAARNQKKADSKNTSHVRHKDIHSNWEPSSFLGKSTLAVASVLTLPVTLGSCLTSYLPFSNQQLFFGMGLLLLLSQCRTSESLIHGDTPTNSNLSEDLHPLIKLSYQNQTASTCSGLRLNKNQVLTEAHCNLGSVMDSNSRKVYTLNFDACVQVKEKCIPVTNVVKHPHSDIAIMTTTEDISKSRRCFDSYITERKLKPNLEQNKCGFKGDLLLAARGLESKEEEGTFGSGSLKLGRFERMKNNPYSATMPNSKAMKGLPNLNNTGNALSMPGDSGGPVYSCNEDTSKLELIGLLHGGDKVTTDLYTPIMKKHTIKWIKKKTQPCKNKKIRVTKIILPNASK